MQLTIDLWQLGVFVAGLATTLIGAFYALQSRLAESQRQTAKTQFDALSAQITALLKVTEGQGDDMRRIERDLMALKAELPRDYVRREDYMQAIATIMTKVEAVALRVEQAIAQVAARQERPQA